LIRTDLRGASLADCSVYGASVWDVKLNDQTKQHNLVITPRDQPAITVDNIKVAQFIYLLLNNQEIREVIDIITSKAVLILGRFSEERKPVLDAIRDELREHDYLPILFDFDPTTNQTINETVKTLAGMSRFVIADLTDARSVPQELQIIDTHCRTVAVRPGCSVCLLSCVGKSGQNRLTLGPIPLFDAAILKIGRIAFFQKNASTKTSL
jgi:hypothetical protein